MKSLIPVVSNPSSSGLSFGNARRKDPNTVFVAGATGQAGIRLAQTLLREGFSVRAGVPELDAAQELARLAAKYMVSMIAFCIWEWKIYKDSIVFWIDNSTIAYGSVIHFDINIVFHLSNTESHIAHSIVFWIW